GTKSWNLPLPEYFLATGMQLLVDVDPDSLVPLATRANLSFPSTGTPQALNVVPGTGYNLVFIPVINSADGSAGNVTSPGITSFTSTLKLLHPMWTATTSLHAPF